MLRTGAIERVLAPLRGDVEVELDLCPVAMAAQTCHSLGLFDESHVAVQNFQRFCDVAMGCEREASAEKYPALASLCETLQLRHGRSAAMLLHGAGRAGAKQNLSSREYAGRLNGGAFHPDTIRRRFPKSEMKTGEIAVHDACSSVIGWAAADWGLPARRRRVRGSVRLAQQPRDVFFLR